MSSIIKHYNSDYYSNLIVKNSINYDKIIKALEVVREFIVKKKLILVGGMAIDLALRLKGEKIYEDDQVPDYDFYSTNHSADAYELSSLLCSKGFENVSCINALHITTMRVRVDFEPVADITYCPETVFNKIPILHYDDIKIVHPYWQMIDQHTSLSLPYENPGREVIFHRWKKDMVRYDKLYDYYPIVSNIIFENIDTIVIDSSDDYYENRSNNRRGYIRSNIRESMSRELELELTEIKIPMQFLSNCCLCGWGAVDYKISDDYVIIKIPSESPISIATDDYKGFIEHNNLELINYYSEYVGSIPRYALCKTNLIDESGFRKNIEVMDTYGKLISAHQINKKTNGWICNIQWAMVYLLVKVFNETNKQIVFTAEEQYLRCRYLVMSGNYPISTVYGNHNLSHSYLNMMKLNKERIYSIKAPVLQPPNNYPTPPECSNNKTFDYETSVYFMIDNRVLDNFIDWSAEPYPEYNSSSIKDKK